ncbi:hydantoinase B/oxoprolinase family protein [Sulfobacillus thermosulfidooxidans]|uniref:hydantoinase B/oxoprolinase family protein n=1 Tax=Sulfobacillus thermosulfidooxidans TaxID=28034 RepID=UPI0009EB45BA|nr:hydantoinase B/oxoprolinase family protein [Sulfobacillus thermosulfidooxidans]
MNAVKLEVFKHLFQAVAEEMGETLKRTSHSPNIKERRDYSCAVFDTDGKIIAQAEHMPVHLGSMPASVAAALEQFVLKPGDTVILNDPYHGGTHLPDVTLVEGVFVEGDDHPVFYVANRAHHADVGGISPGSLPLATEMYQEGLIIPPILLRRQGKMNEDVLKLILRNVRTPDERLGDLSAQLAANQVGARRLLSYIQDHGLNAVQAYAKGLQDYAERVTRSLIQDIPDGYYRFEDFLDDDGQGHHHIAIRVGITIQGDHAMIDFSDSDGQVAGSVNAVRAITVSATFYAFRAVVYEDIPSNEGGFRPLTIVTRPGTVVDATVPAAVAGGNVETSQRIVDVVLGALAQALPEKIPAAGQGTMNNITLGGFDTRKGDRARAFAYYETIGGGAGAGPGWDGAHGVHVHMSNTMNTPIEVLERELPLRIESYRLRRDSGGQGRFRGGDGIVRIYEALTPITVTLLSERREFAPYGLGGGEPGKRGKAKLIPMGSHEPISLPGKWQGTMQTGDRLEIFTPGGGGWGKAD